ncbi:DUF6193 family natural product biosynthesis protein [Streptomyces globisporus]|uniref:DUF6193 family natural product biosynthesis protein n=1 Tax=Streptomyces globisporus TaxID=1908 RepID=UPI0036FF54BD
MRAALPAQWPCELSSRREPVEGFRRGEAPAARTRPRPVDPDHVSRSIGVGQIAVASRVKEQGVGHTARAPGSVEEAVALIVASLPEGCGPAIDGTPDDLPSCAGLSGEALPADWGPAVEGTADDL